MLYAEVAVNASFPHRDAFSYAIPEGMPAAPGCAVYVPFGRLTLQGIVVEVHATPVFSPPEKIRPIRALIDDAPVIDAARVQLGRWISERYLAPLFESIALMLPPGFERKPITTVRPVTDAIEMPDVALSQRQRAVLDAVTASPGIELDALRKRVGPASPDATIAQLERLGLIARHRALARPSVGPRTVEMASLLLPPLEARRRIDDAERPRRSRRADLLERLTQERALPVEAAARLAGGRRSLDGLLHAGAVRFDRNGDHIVAGMDPLEAAEEVRTLRRTRRAAQALAVVRALERAGEATLPDLRASAGADAATVRRLAELGVVALHTRAVERDPLEDTHVTRRPPAHLLPAQRVAADAIIAAIDRGAPRTFLLHGITGSGKTEVYLDALDRCIAAGRRGIVLVPEIALTPQTVRRFRERFERVAVIHSGLTPGELYDQWHGIAAGRYDVVVGARSALFAPQPQLGLIVIDEEHEWTYKSEASPRYHARDAAGELSRLTAATLVLGSATPDAESAHRADRGVYTRLTLPERIRPVIGEDGVRRPVASPAMPSIAVVDLREELHAGNRGMFSRALQAAVTEALAADEQVILFLNRRGLAGHVQCRDCGHVPVCSSCGIALAFHRQYDRLVCHQCNRRFRLPVTCRQCGSPRVRLLGAGVEKVEAEAARLFPHARLLRWDRDATSARGAHERILASFLAHEADILIGTQMLAKGLDLPAVTVVGVISADVGLHLPDFRAGERAFQLITQVAGRAGRGERPGRVIVQTYTPAHYAIDAASRYDYDGFLAQELQHRRSAGYPPYARLVRMLFTHTNERFARDEAARVRRAVEDRRRELGSSTDVLGPSPAFYERVRGRWRWQVLLRGPDPAALIGDLAVGTGWTIDVDPVSML